MLLSATIVSSLLAITAPPVTRDALVIPASDLGTSGTVRSVAYDSAVLAPGRIAFGTPVMFDVPGLDGRHIQLTLERFRAHTPDVQFVQIDEGGVQRPIAFDPESVVLLRGGVAGRPDSHAFVSLSPWGVNGYITGAGVDAGKLWLSSRVAGANLPSGHFAVFAGREGLSLPVPLCGTDHTTDVDAGFDPRGASGILGLVQIEIAVECDYEFGQLFAGDTAAASAYILTLYAVDSDIFTRDAKAHLDVSFVRIWNTINDPYTAASPLNQLADLWNTTMQAVRRDTTQLLSGRRDLSAGGVAWLSSLCTPNAYSWSGYALGYFADPSYPNTDNRDIVISAHELGHNFGTLHTQDYGIDQCHQSHTAPRRGTIMSYCSQLVPGGDAVTDLRFCTRTSRAIREYVTTRIPTCVVNDCNNNSINDTLDIQQGRSADTNSDSIPDECQDCNGNGVLDPIDILIGQSLDQNTNGIPDSCEADCNSNGIPDNRDIALGTSTDLHLNGIPDECEADCDNNSQSDYNQIQLNMDLDIDRDTILDNCQDCNNDGINDLIALNGEGNVWVADYFAASPLREVYGRTGVTMGASTGSAPSSPNDLLITPDGRILVSSGADDRIMEFDRHGVFVRTLASIATVPGLDEPRGMALAPGNTLLVACGLSNRVVLLNLADGSFIRAAIPAGGVAGPFGVAITPGGNIAVTSSNNSVREHNVATGALVGILAPIGAGGLSSPRGICFMPDGRLLVCSFNTDQILEYAAGAFVRQFNHAGIPGVLDLDGPWCVRVGPDGEVYASRWNIPELHLNRSRVYKYDDITGNFIHNYINGHASLIEQPSGFDFMPKGALDCNDNWLPDSCDITRGTSLDLNLNGRPDECESFCPADFNHDGTPDFFDYDDFVRCFEGVACPQGRSADFNTDGSVDFFDYDDFVAAFESGC